MMGCPIRFATSLRWNCTIPSPDISNQGGESLFSMQARMLPGAAMTQVGSNQNSSARQRVRKGSLPDRGEPASQSGSDAKVIPHRVIEIGAVVGALVGQLRVGQPEDLA